MFEIERLLMGSVIVVFAALLVVAVILAILLKICGVTTTAKVVQVKEQRKYKGRTNQQHIAYDYVYQYFDHNKRKHTGRLVKNTPYVEFRVGDSLEIVYIKIFPGKSIYKNRYRMLRFLPWMIALALVVFSFIFYIKF